jgi:hypothetical protein
MLVDPGNLIKNMTLARLEVVTEVHQPSLSLSLSLSLSRSLARSFSLSLSLSLALSTTYYTHTHQVHQLVTASISQLTEQSVAKVVRLRVCMRAAHARMA